MSETVVTKENFQTEVMESPLPVLIDFWAEWCGPCRMLAPTIAEIAAENPDIKVCKVNVDEQPELAQRYDVMSIPMLVIIKNGRIANESVGVQSKDLILKMIK
jgi:thioredoxin 1